MPRGVRKPKVAPVVENVTLSATESDPAPVALSPAGGAGDASTPIVAAPTGKKGGNSGMTTMYGLYLKHYLDASAKYGPKTAIFLQVGGFYELYDTLVVATGAWKANCERLAEICSLTPAPNVSDNPAFECYCWGFPLAALEKYRAILLAAGYTVVTVVQQKSATGDVSRRVIEDISSPGLFSPASVGGGGLIRREEQILLSVYVEPWVDPSRRATHWHIASSAFDVTTGMCRSTETDVLLLDGKPVLDTLTPFWSVYPPAEVCFYWCAGGSTTPTEAQILSLFAGEVKPSVHIYVLDPRAETGTAASRLQLNFLGDIFRHSSAIPVEEMLGITFYPFARRALHHLFQFVKDHNPSYLRLLNDHSIWTPTDSVLLGNAALEQLGMLGSGEKENECLLALLQKPQTAMGRRILRERLLKPTAAVDVLEGRQERIAALRYEASAGGAGLRESLEHVLRGSFDLARLHRRFQLGSAGTEEMLQLLTTYQKASSLLTMVVGAPFAGNDSATEAALRNHVTWILERFSAERIRAATSSTVGGVGGGGVAVGSCHPWTRGIHEDLDAAEDAWLALEGEMRTLRSRLAGLLDEDVEAIKWEIREEAPFTFFTTGRRGAILLANAKRRLGVEITTAKKGSNGAVVIESAEIEAANRRAISVRSAWKTAVVEKWRSELLTWSAGAIDNNMFHSLVEFMGNLDADCCLARLSDEYGYVRPTYRATTLEEEEGDEEEGVGSEESGVVVQGLRHPIIERLGLGTTYVSHNLALGSLGALSALDTTPVTGSVLRQQDTAVAEVGVSSHPAETENRAVAKNGILLYGVNAAGKSSLGKALGLAVLMAQAGMPVAATSMTLAPYKSIFTRILGNDNLWAGMSSFVVEMTEFRSILRNAGPQTLVIGDELCAGTETASATSLVAAGVQTLADRGAHFFFATHLHELAEIPEIAGRTDVGFYHLSVRPSPHATGALIYDRILRPGTGSPMYGLEVCRGLDMDARFLSAAFDFRRRLFSEDGKARLSTYNATVVVERCAVCGSRDRLETHHITPQAAADSRGFVSPGRHKNSTDNLVCLCEGCHSDHHSGVLEIQGWVATTTGRRLQFSRLG